MDNETIDDFVSIPEIESDNIEFKKSYMQDNKLKKSICGFANTSGEFIVVLDEEKTVEKIGFRKIGLEYEKQDEIR